MNFVLNMQNFQDFPSKLFYPYARLNLLCSQQQQHQMLEEPEKRLSIMKVWIQRGRFPGEPIMILSPTAGKHSMANIAFLVPFWAAKDRQTVNDEQRALCKAQCSNGSGISEQFLIQFLR